MYLRMKYSIIVPLYNEEETVPSLFERLVPVCEKLGDYEILCIDDGSKDKTFELLKSAKEKNPNIKIIKFKENSGQSDAFAAGFEVSEGDFVITIDGDLQNPPEEIPKLLEAMDNHDAVMGWRYKRHDSFLKKYVSRLANGFRRKALEDAAHDTGCSLKVFKKEVAKKIKMFKGMHRFLPALSQIEGYKITEVKVDHESRKWGSTKYGTLKRGVPAFLDLLAVYWMKKRRLTYKIDKIL